MTGKIFLSHSATDAEAANTIRAAIEAAGHPCWIAPRDIPPGADWASAIIAAITQAETVLLLHSKTAATSPMVLREINAATDKRIKIIPIRLDATKPADAMQFYLGNTHWLDAHPGPIETHLPKILQALTSPEPAKLALPDKPSLVVLPFQNLSADPEQDYFVDGLVDDITGALSRTGWLFVIARSSAFTYKGRATDIRQIGRDLGVRYVLEGSIRRAGARIRIACQLVEAATGHGIWSDRFDGQLEDVFDLQDRITETVVGALDPTLKSAEIARAFAKPTETLDAYDLYLRALALREVRSAESHQARIALLHQALAIDPGLIRAKSLLCVSHIGRIELGYEQPEDATTAIALAREIVAASTADSESLADAAMAFSRVAADFPAALGAARRAFQLNPNSYAVLRNLGWVHAHANEPESAIPFFERALRLSPRDPNIGSVRAGLGNVLMMLGRTAEALPVLEQALQDAPDWPFIHCCLIITLVRLDRLEDARAAARRLMHIRPGFRLGPRNPLYTPEYHATRREALRAAGIPEDPPT